MTCDPGYYWVKGPDEPEIALWEGEGWGLFGTGEFSGEMTVLDAMQALELAERHLRSGRPEDALNILEMGAEHARTAVAAPQS